MLSLVPRGTASLHELLTSSGEGKRFSVQSKSVAVWAVEGVVLEAVLLKGPDTVDSTPQQLGL